MFNGLNLVWRNLSFSVPQENTKWWKFGSKNNRSQKEQIVLNNGN